MGLHIRDGATADGPYRLVVTPKTAGWGYSGLRFLANQFTERDGQRKQLFAGCLGIFGHGNVAGIGEALLDVGDDLRFHQARNEQATVHTAVGYARIRNRLSTFACTTSVGPGATNLVTGAALATINRVPVLLVPGDVFAGRAANPLLQELEDPRSFDVSVNDCLRPVSRYWDRINRPEQLIPAALSAMRVLTDPAETGAVTLALPHDVQVEAYDFPAEFLAPRVWRVARAQPEPEVLAQAADALRAVRRPLLVAGGGVIYAEATDALRRFAEATGVPVAETQAGKGSLRFDHPASVGAIGATGSTVANMLARDADLVLGVGTRWSDFTTASCSVFGAPDVRFVNLNVAGADTHKHAGLPLVADARVGLTALQGVRDRRCAGREAGRAGPRGVRDGRRRLLLDDGAKAGDRGAGGRKLFVVLVQNHGFASIGALSQSLGSQRFGTAYRHRDPVTGRLDGDLLPVDLAANAASLGPKVLRANGVDEFRPVLRKAVQSSRTTLVQVETDPIVPAPDSGAWWDVPVAEVSEVDTTRDARTRYESHKRTQRRYQ